MTTQPRKLPRPPLRQIDYTPPACPRCTSFRLKIYKTVHDSFGTYRYIRCRECDYRFILAHNTPSKNLPPYSQGADSLL